MSKTQMIDAIIDEMIDDMARIVKLLEELHSRQTRYGPQFAKDMTTEQRNRLASAFEKWFHVLDKLDKMGDIQLDS